MVDYFPKGPKAAETRYKNGLKHQSSESYYMTGEQFRTALYFEDSLIADLYLLKSWDTIKNLKVSPESEKIQKVKIQLPDKTIRFKYLMGKVLGNSYQEEANEK